jgi:uncharacterized protein (DUF1800 family)
MGDNSRRQLLKDALGIKDSKHVSYDIATDKIFKKYANTSLPIPGKKTRSGLNPYTGAFTEKEKIHLLRRTMFGVKPSDLVALNNLSVTQAVDLLLNTVPPTPAPPVNYYQDVDPPDSNDPTVAYGATWVNAPDENGTIEYYRSVSLKAWWLKNIINQQVSIHDKMLLFWTNHFTIQAGTVGDSRFLYKYFELLRTNNLGNFKTFVKDITKDGEMLYYLNGHYNTVGSPDENYARELQELFTIGKEGTSLYDEDDVKAAAKVLTGWRVNKTNITTGFVPAQHDSGNKTFSAFYNNTVIAGQTGANGANELDDLMNMIFSKQQEVAKFICKKLYRYFVYYDIDTQVQTDVINPLAQTFINNNWNIKPVLSQLLKSEHFYDVNSMDCNIKNSMDFLCGLFRTLNINIPNTLSTEDYYKSYVSLYYNISNIAMDVLDPPNVSGWPAYYQAPQFYEMWINSDTLPKRLRMIEALVSDYGLFTHGTFTAKCDVMAFAQTMSDPSDPTILINDIVKYMLGIGLIQATKDSFKIILTGGTVQNPNPDYYWTNDWNGWLLAPTNTAAIQAVKIPLQNLLRKLLSQEEHQLS